MPKHDCSVHRFLLYKSNVLWKLLPYHYLPVKLLLNNADPLSYEERSMVISLVFLCIRCTPLYKMLTQIGPSGTLTGHHRYPRSPLVTNASVRCGVTVQTQQKGDGVLIILCQFYLPMSQDLRAENGLQPSLEAQNGRWAPQETLPLRLSRNNHLPSTSTINRQDFAIKRQSCAIKHTSAINRQTSINHTSPVNRHTSVTYASAII